jgi:membrane dipeptidase
MIIIDGHQDLAWNMLTFGRDYTRSVAETRRLEAGLAVETQAGVSLLGWPDFQLGQVAVIFATLFVTPERWRTGAWDTQVYSDYNQAARLYHAQLDSYQRLVDEYPDHFQLIQRRADLQAVLAEWKDIPPDRYEMLARGAFLEEQVPDEQAAGKPDSPEDPARKVGLVLLMEGAEGVREPGELEEWWAKGVRIIGPAWAGTRFCGGTREPGPLTKDGFALLDGMAALGFILDVSHMDEMAALQALDTYPGAIIASHANVQSLLKGQDSNRHLSERVIHGLIERQAVIGVMPLNQFLQAGWKSGDRRSLVSLDRLLAHIDSICQIAGDAQHVALGSDFDGGFGLQNVPAEIDTIADLRKLIPMLVERGYIEDDIAAILGQNWARLLQLHLPEHV